MSSSRKAARHLAHEQRGHSRTAKHFAQSPASEARDLENMRRLTRGAHAHLRAAVAALRAIELQLEGDVQIEGDES